jgi:PPE-repeat protein
MASPPEVHSALLSSGPGPGPLLASAAAWNSLSVEYGEVADEISELVTGVQSGAWAGPSAESYVAANAPYAAWLMQASADSAATAAQHETAASAYSTALSAMPTLGELVANHTSHAVLVATNFFGINTIPIAFNEADYVRMWVQAATTMSSYEAVSDTAVASAPQTAAAPQIVKSGIGNSQVAHDPTVSNALDTAIAHVLQNFGYHWNPAAGTLNGEEYDYYTNPGQSIFYVARALEVLEDFQQFGVYLTQDPVHAFQYLMNLALFDWPTHIAEFAPALSQSSALAAAATSVAVAPVGSVGGFAGLAGLAGVPAPVQVPVPVGAAAPMPVVPEVFSAAGTVPVAGAPTAAAGAPASAASTVAGAAPPPPSSPPVAAGGAGFAPYVIGPPGIGFGSGMSNSASSSAKKKAPESGAASAEAAAVAATRERARARRRRRAAVHRDQADEFMDMNVEVDPDWTAPPSTTASDQGAATLGFAGTTVKQATAAGGLVTLGGGEFGNGPLEPMLPDTWDDRESK